MFLSHMETSAFFPFHITRTHFPSRDFIQQEVLILGKQEVIPRNKSGHVW